MLAHIKPPCCDRLAPELFDGPERLHWVHVEYLTQDGPPEDHVLWKREAAARLWPTTQLPDLQHTLGGPGFQSTSSVLKQMVPELVVSKQKLRQAENSCLVRIKREEKNQTLGFSSRPFVLCGLPVRRPPGGELLFERRNGSFLLQITGHPEFGLPSGRTD